MKSVHMAMLAQRFVYIGKGRSRRHPVGGSRKLPDALAGFMNDLYHVASIGRKPTGYETENKSLT